MSIKNRFFFTYYTTKYIIKGEKEDKCEFKI